MKSKYNCMFMMIVFLFGCGNSIYAQNKMFGLGSEFHCMVVDDKVKFFYIDGDYNWNELKEAEFTLPNGYKDVFGYGNNTLSLAVVVDNKVKFFYNDTIYFYHLRGDHVRNNWREITASEFTLPNGYKNVFWYFEDYLGVVVNNKVKLFTSWTDWVEITDSEFIIPTRYTNRYKNIFGLLVGRTFYYCMAVDNKLKFFYSERNNWYEIEWKEKTDYEITLPDGYYDVFRFGESHFCIVVDNKAKLFNNVDNNWNERTEFEFQIK